MAPMRWADDTASAAAVEPGVADEESPTFVAKLDDAKVVEPDKALFAETIMPDWPRWTLMVGSFSVLVTMAILAPFFVPDAPGPFRVTVTSIAIIQLVLAVLFSRIRVSVHADRVEVQQGPFRRTILMDEVAAVEEGHRGWYGVRVESGPVSSSGSLRYANRSGAVVVLRREGAADVVVSPVGAKRMCEVVNGLIAARTVQ